MACDANELAEAAKCLSNMPSNVLLGIIARTLCEGTVFSCGGQSGAGSPVGSATPDFTDQLYHDTTADTYWRSTGLTNADWTEISGGGGSDDLSYTTNAGKTYADLLSELAITVRSPNPAGVLPGITSLTYNKVTNLNRSIDFWGTNIGWSVQTFSFPVLARLNAWIDIEVPTCTQILLPALSALVDTGNNGFFFIDCPLTSFSMPSLSAIDDGYDITIANAALDAASVNGILAKLVSFPTWGTTGATINIGGGTSAAPSGQGILDKGILIGRGASVTTN